MRTLLLALALIPTVIIDYSPTKCCYPEKLLEEVKIDPAQVKCLAVTIYGESRGEPIIGQIAVAYIIMNRAVKKTVCSVVLAPKQFSIFNNNSKLKAVAMSLDQEPLQKNSLDERSWALAKEIANMVIRRNVEDPTTGSTHYLAYKSLHSIPLWTYKFTKIAQIGNHTFFKDERV